MISEMKWKYLIIRSHIILKYITILQNLYINDNKSLVHIHIVKIETYEAHV
jgi:hypothetical protein